jgi:subfamily B ATP-binding cassette protein MsbA
MLMQKCLVYTTHVFELMELKSAIQDAADAKVLSECRGGITFRDVGFSYGLDTKVLHNFNLEVEPGKQYALVGASGAGKTTMLSLILRFYDPQAGVIQLDGLDLRAITQRSLREHIGIVTQETFLFHDTIYENIRYGRLDASEAEIHAAARLAYAHDFILAQPEGYDTIVGDKGCLLCGGPQQRLAIARALLKNAPVLLLDEATSALDSESERMIQAALERLANGRTVIAIAHRLSTILKSDKIVVMDHGPHCGCRPLFRSRSRTRPIIALLPAQFHREEAAAGKFKEAAPLELVWPAQFFSSAC